MSVVTIQLGQCGNQIGTSLFNALMADATTPPSYSSQTSVSNEAYEEEVSERFFCQHDCSHIYTARAVMVDTEPKVINQCILQAQKSAKWAFSQEASFYKKKGSGNNWAQGYQKYGEDLSHEVMNLARKEVEKCDWFSGFLILMSLAGGTGSGLGTYLTHCLHDNFEDAYIVNNVIWPYSSGEVVLQYYNTILSLSHLYQSSDAVIIMENDHLNKICTQLLSLKHVSFEDVNKVIGHKIASVLQPAYSNTTSRTSNTIGNIVKDLCCHPSYKLLSLKNIPQISDETMKYSTFVWPALLKHLRQMLIADAPFEEGIDWSVKVAPSLPSQRMQHRTTFNKSIANALVLRGKDCLTVPLVDFQQSDLYASWLPESWRLPVWYQQRAFMKYEKSATLLSNSQSFVAPLEMVLRHAWSMFASRAYLHQYNRYGLLEDDFVDSFGFTEQILSDYRQL